MQRQMEAERAATQAQMAAQLEKEKARLQADRERLEVHPSLQRAEPVPVLSRCNGHAK